MRALPASLAIGQVGHTRHRPRHHSLRYRMASVLVDIDGPDTPASRNVVFGFNRPALVSLFTRDFGRPDMTVRAWVEARLRAVGLESELGRIQLLAAPRILGLAFNPVSVFFAFRPDGSLAGLVFEVSNFHSGRGAYAVNLPRDHDPDEAVRFVADKRFFVSPFNPVAGEYIFRLARHGATYQLGIQLVRDGQRILSAVHTATLKPLTPSALGAVAWLVGGNTARIFFAILWEALKLRLKGLATFAPRRGTIDTTPGRH
ncbi:hypothetical protein AWH62_00105 [Maricaulis sp. W15]|uniref:DUF1365 domain-containing protein n=1 Tax=Maricaulis sp. W15 TaxID=1772333 RepID=UPI0009489FA0|nr:DUF1365 domain-containing protein [Maricaulis sp. W15]OLF81117.1 hypothetical protein AWH62_00105 [Maricaulis sp. W15]